MDIRIAEASDIDALLAHDRHITRARLEHKIAERQVLVLMDGDSFAGWLRWGLFWDNTPFCTMLYVERDDRRRGYGSKLMRHWELDMQSRGYDLLLVSTQADEDAQHVYRKLGYRDCGGLVLEHQPMELLLMKRIRETAGCPGCGEAARA